MNEGGSGDVVNVAVELELAAKDDSKVPDVRGGGQSGVLGWFWYLLGKPTN